MNIVFLEIFVYSDNYIYFKYVLSYIARQVILNTYSKSNFYCSLIGLTLSMCAKKCTVVCNGCVCVFECVRSQVEQNSWSRKGWKSWVEEGFPLKN